MMSSSKWEETLKEDYSLAGAMSYCLGKKERLRVAVDWLYIIFTYDDLLDDATSKLAFDERGATEASKIMLSVLIDPDNFKPIPSLPIATVFHQYVLRLNLPGVHTVFDMLTHTVSGYDIAQTHHPAYRSGLLMPS